MCQFGHVSRRKACSLYLVDSDSGARAATPTLLEMASFGRFCALSPQRYKHFRRCKKIYVCDID
jgi:hypothetical protein